MLQTRGLLRLISTPSRSRSAISGRSTRVKCLNVLAAPPQTNRPLSTIGGGARSLSSSDLDDDNPHIAYELVQGPLARWSRSSADKNVPTAVLVHGILGSRRNLSSFARMLVEGFPAWQVLLVDVRCHGESAGLPNRPLGPHTVETAASDILTLLRKLKLFPHALIGHSFGGKVTMSMVQQFGTNTLPRPVQVWVLDSLPGETVRAGEPNGRDHPRDLIATLQRIPLNSIRSRNDVTDILQAAGFSKPIAQWAATNLRQRADGHEWTFDLDGILQMYDSYESTSLWPMLERPPQGLKVDFVKAEGSSFRWGGDDEERIHALGHKVHLLRNAGHWVHTDNPLGLFDILSHTFGDVPDLHQQRATHSRYN